MTPTLPVPSRRRLAWLQITALLGLLGAQAVTAQLPASTPASAPSLAAAVAENGVSPAQVDELRASLDADASLSETQKQKGIELLDQAKKSLQEGDTVLAEQARLNGLAKGAPKRIAEIKALLGDPDKLARSLPKLKPNAPLDQIDAQISQEDLALTQARTALKVQEDELARLLVGAKTLSEDIAARITRLEQIEADLKTAVPDEPQLLQRIRSLTLKARKRLRQAELDLFRTRLSGQNLFTELAQGERDLLAAEIGLRQPRVDGLKEQAQRIREAEAAKARQEAEAVRASAAPAIQSIATEVARLRKELEDVVRNEKAVSERLDAVRRGLVEVKGDFERTQQRVEVAGPTESIGRLLRKRRDALPSAYTYRRAASERRQVLSQATDRQIEVDERQRDLADLNAVVEQVIQGLPADTPEAERARLREEATTLAQSRRDAINELQKVLGRYISQLTVLDVAERHMLEVAEAFTAYIDDQLLWIPNTRIESLGDPVRLTQATFWLISPLNFVELAQDLWELLIYRPGWVVLLATASVALLALRRRALAGLVAVGQGTRKIRTDSFTLTLYALLYTAIIAAPLPLLFMGSGVLLITLASAHAYTISVGQGLFAAGMVLVTLGALRDICRDEGLADRHLRWSDEGRELLFRELRWLILAFTPLGFVIAATGGNAPIDSAQSLGRLAFVAAMGVGAFAAWRIWRSRSPLIQARAEREHPTWITQLHFLWFPAIVALPLLLALTSVLGYYYTALNLVERVHVTFWFFVALVLLRDLLLRWLYVAERRLRLEDALRRREELRAQRAKEEHGEEATEAAVLSVEIPELDYNQLGEQAKRLLRTGFLFAAIIGTWLVWKDMLPALNFLERTELPFTASQVVDGVAKELPVTLADVAVGLIIAIITVLAAKNLPGVLEITLLQRLPIDQGARYAITTLSQYLIVAIGIFATFSSLGLQWSNIQWLVAALSVGLGFGLQEIVANFISGVILLFERPIRVGDVVTVEGTSGVVSRIRIRATTITNWDRQELLVPNKSFITGRLINWTLSDKTNRIQVTVGAAYGTDVRKAMALMLEAAAENEQVLEDPKPLVSFEGFGDNSLTLQLRAYLATLEFRLATITALHQAVYDKFNAAGIEIAYPQRDVHLSTSAPLDIRMSRAGRAGKGGPSEGV